MSNYTLLEVYDPETDEYEEMLLEDESDEFRNAGRHGRVENGGGGAPRSRSGRSTRRVVRRDQRSQDRSAHDDRYDRSARHDRYDRGGRHDRYDRGGRYDHGDRYALIRRYESEPEPPIQTDRHYLQIRKSAIAEAAPVVTDVLAAYLGLPQRPMYSGSARDDYENMAMYHEALATHEQNQLKLKTLGDILERGIKLFTGN